MITINFITDLIIRLNDTGFPADILGRDIPVDDIHQAIRFFKKVYVEARELGIHFGDDYDDLYDLFKDCFFIGLDPSYEWPMTTQGGPPTDFIFPLTSVFPRQVKSDCAAVRMQIQKTDPHKPTKLNGDKIVCTKPTYRPNQTPARRYSRFGHRLGTVRATLDEKIIHGITFREMREHYVGIAPDDQVRLVNLYLASLKIAGVKLTRNVGFYADDTKYWAYGAPLLLSIQQVMKQKKRKVYKK